MSSLGNHINFTPFTSHQDNGHALHLNGFHGGPSRSRTPNILVHHPNGFQLGNAPDGELGLEEDPKSILFRDLYNQSEARLDALFGKEDDDSTEEHERNNNPENQNGQGAAEEGQEQPTPPPKKPARNIDEDDYDDSDDDEEEVANNVSPLKARSTGANTIPRIVSPTKLSGIPPSPALTSILGSSIQWQGKTSDDVRKRLEEDKKAAEEKAKRSLQIMFYTIDNDRDAMLEQQKLEESDRQVDVEMSGHGIVPVNPNAEGSLSQANLGASSLVLKHLIARIDAKREKVQASDQELRNLMIEVKKNRSKWAHEDKIGQEELYEAAEKVLSEVKAMTEHSQPFLQKVNKRDAPDYHNVIKHPMDLSTMTRRLKSLYYKSKQDFVEDLNLIWSNCLKYNANPDHFLRRHALFMRKETEKLIPLIPDIVIRDRAEVEAEERRQQAVDGDVDGGEDSDDEPIISSRGRKAPSKKAKKGSIARKAPVGASEGSPGVESKPPFQNLASNGSSSNLKNEFLRADSDVAMEGSQNGLSTPPPGTATPAGLNGIIGSAHPRSSVDPMEVDGFGVSANGANSVHPLGGPDVVDHDDLEYKTWKQVTKRDRALVAAERHRLFKGDHINPEEPALLRSKLGMRRWARKQRDGIESVLGKRKRDIADDGEPGPSGETLAEGMEGTEEKVLPDYYDTTAAIPELPPKLQWIEDADGQIIQTSEENLHIVPKGLFTSPDSPFTRKMDSNLRQMQETRKICTKIGIVKQMQLQSQMYQNQFQKYDPEPFVEQDIEPHVVSDDGPIMSQTVCRAALQRSVGKIFYHAGFEEFQPSALEAITDLASEYFVKLARSLAGFMQVPKVPVVTNVPGTTEPTITWKPKFSTEETLLHCLLENGIDVESLESYVKDDVERTTGKLGVVHDRMKAHLADLLRPALNDAGPDGVNAFNDGSDQFVGGDFAEDLDEDFFGFKELGLDKEFGLASLSVPLHLLQNRMHNAYQQQNPSSTSVLPSSLPPPEPYPAVTIDSLPQEIGLIQSFFLDKLSANNNSPLVEDEDLPQKQRFPKPRLPPTGKISSPRKKPQREVGPGKGHPRKKMKLVEGGVWVRDDGAEKEKEKEKGGKVSLIGKTGAGAAGVGTGLAKGKGSALVDMKRSESRDADGDGDNDGDADADADADGDLDDGVGVGVLGIGMEKVGKGKGNENKSNGINGTTTRNGGTAGHVGGEGGMISPESLEAT